MALNYSINLLFNSSPKELTSSERSRHVQRFSFSRQARQYSRDPSSSVKALILPARHESPARAGKVSDNQVEFQRKDDGPIWGAQTQRKGVKQQMPQFFMLSTHLLY